jgi:stage V sporulation protein G
VFFAAHTEVVNTKEVELKLDLIRVVCDPNPLFKYQLLYKDGIATGMVGVYSFDEDWYYLYKDDTERYKVKRCKDLEGIPPAFTYKQQRRREVKPDNTKPFKQSVVADPPALEEALEETAGMQMSEL